MSIRSVFGSDFSIVPALFKKDEPSKWFGLVADSKAGASGDGKTKNARIVVTPRFEELVDRSVVHSSGLRKRLRQRPRLVSFVGETGAGKSTLIRLLMKASDRDLHLGEPTSGDPTTFKPTTGEVNLYPDPESFGSLSPIFFADCEGLACGEPISVQHQSSWFRHGTSYWVDSSQDSNLRELATAKIYPKLLYLLSDVVCMVTANQKTSAELAKRVLDWGRTGALAVVNQETLPALIIISNKVEGQFEDTTATESFFEAIDDEINHDTQLKELARENRVTTIRELFGRCFSSTHVCQIPARHFQAENDQPVAKRVNCLRERILSDSDRVRDRHAKIWRRVDSSLMSSEFRVVFEHVTSAKTTPLDLSPMMRRQDNNIEQSAITRVTQFLRSELQANIQAERLFAARFLALSITRNALRGASSSFYDPQYVYSTAMEGVCGEAVKQFRREGQQCSYLDEKSELRCVNTMEGHSKGHQDSRGNFLANGSFSDGNFDDNSFLETIKSEVSSILKGIKSEPSDVTSYLSQQQRDLLRARGPKNHVPHIRSTRPGPDCPLCIFGRPEYALPCGHYICEHCLVEFAETGGGRGSVGDEDYVIHKECPHGPLPFHPPYKAPVRPQFSGLRMLCLDGGGVRGAIQLITLRRIEDLIGLGLGIGEFFDLIVGTGTGALTALKLVKDGQSATECLATFEQIVKGMFSRPLTYNIRSWFASRFGYRFSHFPTSAIRESIRRAYRPQTLLGIKSANERLCGSSTRVAVTTTVDYDCRLLTNYCTGDGQRYLSSSLQTYEAAQAASSLPFYFEPFESPVDRTSCRDGSLCATSYAPSVALVESRAIWGPSPKVDLLLSLGPGSWPSAAKGPDWLPQSPERLVESLKTAIKSADGEEAWNRFVSTEGKTAGARGRFWRLNPKFNCQDLEPELDATGRIGEIKSMAESHVFHFPGGDTLRADISSQSSDLLSAVADLLRASMFYFHVDCATLTESRGDVKISGSIRCRLAPPDQEEAFIKLFKMSPFVSIKDKSGNRTLALSAVDGRLKADVEITGELQAGAEQATIEVVFKGRPPAAVSGFPTTAADLYRQFHDNR